MGKKKIATQTEGDALKESAVIDAASAKASKSISKKIETGRAYINASYNNTVITVTDEKGDVLGWATAGSLGFSGPKKATPFAASKIVSALTEKLKKSGPAQLHVYVRGVGSGRDAAIRSFANQGFEILSIEDVTPIPHNGPRKKKVRRV